MIHYILYQFIKYNESSRVIVYYYSLEMYYLLKVMKNKQLSKDTYNFNY